MNKKSICVAIASLLCLGGITACSEIEAKENGKKTRDYDTTNNVELAAYLGQEITYNGIHFNIEEYPEENNWRLEVYSTNEEIKSYDVIEIYDCDLNGKLWSDYIMSPVTFQLKSNKVAYYDLGHIHIGLFGFYRSEKDSYSFIDELRIIGENANLTFHLWRNGALISNGKTVNNYRCENNQVKSAPLDGCLKTTVKDSQFTLEAFYLNKPYIKNTLCIQGFMAGKYTVDIVEVYATDANDENRVNLMDKPSTMDFEKNSLYVAFLLNDVSKDYYELCNGNIRYHVVTNYFTGIFQNYDYLINGKTKSDYDLSDLLDFYGKGNTESINSVVADNMFDISKDNRFSTCYLFGFVVRDEVEGKIYASFNNGWTNCISIDSFDIIEVYFTNDENNEIKYVLTTPITMHKYSNSEFRFVFDIDTKADDYYAFSKLHFVTNLGYLHIDIFEE